MAFVIHAAGYTVTRRVKRSMTGKIKFLLIYLLGWVFFFDLARFIFLVYNWEKTRQLSFEVILLSFWHGLLMDLSMASYILLPVCFFVLFSLFMPFFQRPFIYRLYTLLVLFPVTLLLVCDLELYRAWGFRMDASPLKYLDSPKEVMASVSHLPWVWFFLGFMFVWLGAFYSFRYLVNRFFFPVQSRHRLPAALGILIITLSLVIPIRGGLQLAPLSQSSVYFSANMYANHTAINPVWNFIQSYLNQGADKKNPYRYLTETESRFVADSLYTDNGVTTDGIITVNGKPVNIILVIWESFSEKIIHEVIGQKEVTPRFNQYRKEGLFFSNMYASGDRTSKGIPSILSGYPALPATSIIHTPAKAEKLRVITELFREKGYQTPFYYGGDPEFANIKSYLLHAGFDPVIGKKNFASKDRTSKWGVHDGVVMPRVFDELARTGQPFFATWLTLSSHEPYETPIPAIFPGKDFTTKFLNAHHYTDQVIGEFLDKCRAQSWWNNTLVIITGDHGHPLPKTNQKASEFKTPMLWLGGALEQKGMIVDHIVSQLDIVATLAGQLKMEHRGFPFSRNIFSPDYREWAFFSFNDGFGFINRQGEIIYDNVGNQVVEKIGTPGEMEIKAGKALMQLTYEDFLKK